MIKGQQQMQESPVIISTSGIEFEAQDVWSVIGVILAAAVFVLVWRKK